MREELTLTEFQSQVDQWIRNTSDGYWPALANLARLTEEVGELARLINHQVGPKKKKPGEIHPDLIQEFGDLLFILGTLANQLEVNLEEAAYITLDKVRGRG